MRSITQRVFSFLVTAPLLVTALALATGLAAQVTASEAATAADSLLLSSDQAFFSAVSKSDGDGLAKLLDADFTWTDANGVTLSRSQLLKTPPKPAMMSGQDVEESHYNYGNVGVLESNRGKVHTVR